MHGGIFRVMLGWYFRLSAALLTIFIALAVRAGLMLAAGSRPSQLSRSAIFVPAFAIALYATRITQPPSRDLLCFGIVVGHQLWSLGAGWFESRAAGNGLAWVLTIVPVPLLWAIPGIRQLELLYIAAASVFAGATAYAAMQVFQRLSHQDADACLRWSSRIDLSIAAVFLLTRLSTDHEIAAIFEGAAWRTGRTESIVLISAFLIFSMAIRSRT